MQRQPAGRRASCEMQNLRQRKFAVSIGQWRHLEFVMDEPELQRLDARFSSMGTTLAHVAPRSTYGRCARSARLVEHPMFAFIACCRLVGTLAMFTPNVGKLFRRPAAGLLQRAMPDAPPKGTRHEGVPCSLSLSLHYIVLAAISALPRAQAATAVKLPGERQRRLELRPHPPGLRHGEKPRPRRPIRWSRGSRVVGNVGESVHVLDTGSGAEAEPARETGFRKRGCKGRVQHHDLTYTDSRKILPRDGAVGHVPDAWQAFIVKCKH